MKTHWKKLNNYDYIGAYTLMEGDAPIDLDVTITSVSTKEVTGEGNRKDLCMVAELKGQKPFIINATNAKMIQNVLKSPYVEDWIGKTITLYVAQVKAFGEVHDALRVRPNAPQKEQFTPSHPKWKAAKKAITDGNAKIEDVKKKYEISEENIKLLTDGAV